MQKESAVSSRRALVKKRVSDEFKRFIYIFLYLWAVFAVLSVRKSFVLAQHRVDYTEQSFAIVNAFVFAKVVLIGEHFHFGDRLKNVPLIYPVLYESFVFTLLITGFHIVESVLVGLWHGDSITISLVAIGMGRFRGILSAGIVSFIVLLPFFAFNEIGRVIGNKELGIYFSGVEQPILD